MELAKTLIVTIAGMTGVSRSRYRVRVTLDYTEPELWRSFELVSDMSLEELHGVIQTAFGWDDSHLHDFSTVTSIRKRKTETFRSGF
jgi:hypothetical protein